MHFVGNTTWFAVLLVIHVFGAIAGIGPSFAFAVMGPLAGKLGGPPALGVLEAMHAVESKIVLPTALVLQWLTGVGLIFNRGLNHDFFNGHHAWLLWAILLYISIVTISLTVNTPTLKKMIAMAKSGPPGEEFQRLAARAAKAGPLLTVMTVAIVVLMIWKPGSGCGPLYRC